MNKANWVWMPHHGHLIIGYACRFHLNTYVGGYIVSTVGEWWPERSSREIHARVYDPEWLAENQHLLGDTFDHAYMKKFGFEEIGVGRTYETMVFKATKDTENICCPWKMDRSPYVEMDGYTTAADAYQGHLKLCEKYSKVRI